MATCDYAASQNLLSQDDLSLLTKSFKNEKFREIFREYAEELCDPQKRKLYESELKQYEKERGVDILFVEPRPGLSLQARSRNGGATVWVNVCSSDAIQKPSFEVVTEGVGVKRGQKWSFPHAMPPPRREVVRLGGVAGDVGQGTSKGKENTSTVHDVVFHPNALSLASHNAGIKKAVIETALESLEKSYELRVDDPKEVEGLSYAGQPTKSVIRRVVDQNLVDESEKSSLVSRKMEERTRNSVSVQKKDKNNKTKEGIAKATVKATGSVSPVYKLKYISKLDLQDFAIPLIPHSHSGSPSRPQALEVEVQLPGVLRAAQVDAHVSKQTLHLTTDSTPQYKLELQLPHPVDDDAGSAKFDVATQKLTLAFPVIPADKKESFSPHSPSSFDSGIECETGYRTNSDGDNSSEVSVSSQEEMSGEQEVDENYDVFGSASPTPPSPPSKAVLTPNYTLKQTPTSLLLTLHCGNVLASSIDVCRTDSHKASIELSSIGGGQTLLHYALDLSCEPHSIAEQGLSYEVGESCVEVTVEKAKEAIWESCEVGRRECMTSVQLELPAPQSPPKIKVAAGDGRSEGVVEAPLAPLVVPRSPRVCRTVSLCEGEEPALKARGPTCSWPRGILKRRTRSLSESQVSTAVAPQPILGGLGSSLDLEDDDDEYDDDCLASSGEKKSVRFNEVVSRQTFRTNRSILMERQLMAKIDAKRRRTARRKDRRRGNSETSETATTTEDDTDTTTNTDTCGGDTADETPRTTAKKNRKNRSKNKASDEDDDNTRSDTDKDDSSGGEKKKKGKKNKKKFEPSNTFIFQLDIEA